MADRAIEMKSDNCLRLYHADYMEAPITSILVVVLWVMMQIKLQFLNQCDGLPLYITGYTTVVPELSKEDINFHLFQSLSVFIFFGCFQQFHYGMCCSLMLFLSMVLFCEHLILVFWKLA